MSVMFRLLTVLMGLALAGPAFAHSQSYGYLTLTPGDRAIAGSLDLAVRDLDTLYDLDQDRDGQITWGELRAREGELQAAVLSQISAGTKNETCKLTPGPVLIDSRGGETYAAFPFAGPCPALTGNLVISYDLMFKADAQHRGLVAVKAPDGTRSLVMTPGSTRASIDVAGSGWLDRFLSFIAHGAHHIWIGYDHILFLITLLLGTSFQTAQVSIRRAMTEAAKVITAFTLSHSLTLALAATGFLRVPVALAESLIAVTIVAAAVNNIRPVLTSRIWLMALVFGLVHGIGFANVLIDLGLPRQSLLGSLLAFNIGVELGQLAIAALALPVLLALARRPVVLAHGLVAVNALIAAIGAAWFSDRVFATALMPF